MPTLAEGRWLGCFAIILFHLNGDALRAPPATRCAPDRIARELLRRLHLDVRARNGRHDAMHDRARALAANVTQRFLQAFPDVVGETALALLAHAHTAILRFTMSSNE